MLILGIESSCDETAVALVEDGHRILCSHISSQIALHRPYGGVVPELASRSHLEQFNPLLGLALQTAGCTYQDIDAIAVTVGPGLQGALMVGFTAAQTLSWLWQRPLLGVHHLEGHIYSAFLGTATEPQFPLLVLLVSGGHTQLLSMAAHGQYEIVANTRDDAVGEAFDKVARMLGLPYPGGPAIDQAAQSGNEQAFLFPTAMRHQADFSFSGLKTAVLYTVRELEAQTNPLPVADLCASFQRVAIDSLMLKLSRHLQSHRYQQVAIVGGVSANSRLRQQLQQLSQQQQWQSLIPPLDLCTDNAAMIAAAAYYRQRYCVAQPSFSLQVKPRLPLVA